MSAIPENRPSEQSGEEVVLAFVAGMETRDPEAIFATFADEIIVEIPYSESGSVEEGEFRRYVGIDEVRPYFALAPKLYREIRFDVTDLSVTGDGGRVFLEFYGDMITQDGQPYRNRHIWRFDLSNGQIIKLLEYLNPVTTAKSFGRPIGVSLRGNTKSYPA